MPIGILTIPTFSCLESYVLCTWDGGSKRLF